MAWGIVYYAEDDGSVPAEKFLDDCPSKIDARFNAVLEAVRAAPPPQFSGGGYWEAMHGEMGGYYEIRLTGPGRRQYRLFCLLDNGTEVELLERGFDEPKIAVLTGMVKPPGTKFSRADYRRVRDLGEAFLGTTPRQIAKYPSRGLMSSPASARGGLEPPPRRSVSRMLGRPRGSGHCPLPRYALRITPGHPLLKFTWTEPSSYHCLHR